MALAGATRITCADVSKDWTDIARRYWQKAGVAGRIDLHLDGGNAVIARARAAGEAGSFDRPPKPEHGLSRLRCSYCLLDGLQGYQLIGPAHAAQIANQCPDWQRLGDHSRPVDLVEPGDSGAGRIHSVTRCASASLISPLRASMST
jgi:hypothetical protein